MYYGLGTALQACYSELPALYSIHPHVHMYMYFSMVSLYKQAKNKAHSSNATETKKDNKVCGINKCSKTRRWARRNISWTEPQQPSTSRVHHSRQALCAATAGELCLIEYSIINAKQVLCPGSSHQVCITIL